MKSFIDSLLTALAIILFIPTLLILISWNAIPGDRLYPVKGWFEDVALAITIKTPLASIFSIKFTERRFSEANRLLAKRGSTLGYTLLVAEARESKDIIIDKNDSKSASELIVKIEEYQKNLEEKKVAVKTASQTVAYIPTSPTPISQIVTNKETGKTPSPFPTHTQTPYPIQTSQSIFQTAPAPTPAPSTDAVVVDLETTSVELEKIKDELKSRVPSHIREEERRRDDPRSEGTRKPKETQSPTPVEILAPTSTPLTTTPYSTSTPTGGEY